MAMICSSLNLDAFMSISSQELEPPAIPERFNSRNHGPDSAPLSRLPSNMEILDEIRVG